MVTGWAILLGFAGMVPAQAQIPGLPGPAAPPTKPTAEQDKTKGAVAAPTGAIAVKERVSDQAIQEFLAKFLPRYPGVRQVDVKVDDGVVTLDGQVSDEDTQEEINEVVRRVEGVRLVLNHMKTDEDVMTASQLAVREIDFIRGYLARKWLLILLSLGLVALSALSARLFATRAETWLSPFVRNVMLRSVVGSVISSLIVIGGVLLALSALNLTQAVLSILGLAGVVGLAVGFAFRDITENFIASVLLGVRRPFQIGDYVTVAGQSGVIKSLNTRATVLVTLEGNHIRIPNSVIFKEILTNTTASPSVRNSFDVVIPNDASAAAAIAAISQALGGVNGILHDPPPRVLVQELEPAGVRLRAYFWTPTHGSDPLQVASDARLQSRAALQRAGVIPSSADAAKFSDTPARQRPTGPMPVHAPTSTAQATGDGKDDGHLDPRERVLNQPMTRVSEEGTNLLTDAKSE